MNPPEFETPASRPDALVVCGPTEQADARATLENYYRVIFALARGNTHRPPFPFGLILYVLQFAELASPYPSKSLSDFYTWRLYASPPFRARRIQFLKTPPLTADDVRDIVQVEVVINFVYNIESKVSASPLSGAVVCFTSYTHARRNQNCGTGFR